MKVLHFSSARSWRGGEQQIIYLYEELKKLKVKQWIYCVKNSAIANYCKQYDIPHIVYKKRFSTNPFVAWKLNKIITSLKIDLIHIHDAHSHTYSFISTILGNRLPFVLSRRVDFPVKNNWFSHQKYNHPSIKKIISVSNYVQQILEPAINDKHKLCVIHSGIDINRFSYKGENILKSDFNIPSDTKIIANIAAIAPHKDYFTFVDTASILLQKNKQLKFLIIGSDGGEQAAIQTYIQNKNLSKYFILTGFRQDIPQISPEIDVFLFTSKEEGLGTSVIDALACGLPVVATAAGGIPEIINNEKCGLLASIEDPVMLAQNVEKILTNSGLAQQLNKAGKIRAAQFSKEKTALKTYEVYKSVLVTIKQ